jgi:hypothetical protein
MKCHVEFDFTPLEARQFVGLPDVQPMQERVMAEMERKMLAEMERFSPESVLKSWMSAYFQAPEQLKDAFNAMLNGMRGGTK